jgi:MFS transporter, MHS family, proline/betaine transporter
MDVRILQNGPAERTDLHSSIDEAGALGLSADFPNGPDLVSRRPLTSRDYKTLVLAALGGALEFYDFIIFIFFAQAVGQLFFPAEIPDWLRQFQTLSIFAVGYFVRPLGGILIAHFGDLLGRKRMFLIGIVLMTVATLAMGLLPTYREIGALAPTLLLLLRILQGAAVGGEVPGAWVFVAEHVPANRVGFACGTLTAGLTVGILLGSTMATTVNSLFTPAEILAWAWRLPFVFGGALGLGAVCLRRLLHETPVFEEIRKRKALAEELPLKAVLRDHRGAVIVSMLLTWLLSAAIVVVILMTPQLLQKQGVPLTTALKANNVATLSLIAGNIIWGAIIDRIGPGRFFAVGCGLLGVSIWLFYTQSATAPSLLLPLYALTGLFVGIVGGVPYVMVHAFPARLRFSGVSFSYNVAYAIFGGLTPLFISLLLPSLPLAHLYYLLALCALGSAVGLGLWRAERRKEKKDSLLARVKG